MRRTYELLLKLKLRKTESFIHDLHEYIHYINNRVLSERVIFVLIFATINMHAMQKKYYLWSYFP